MIERMTWSLSDVRLIADPKQRGSIYGPSAPSICLDVAESEIVDPTGPSSFPSAAIEVGGPSSSQIVGATKVCFIEGGIEGGPDGIVSNSDDGDANDDKNKQSQIRKRLFRTPKYDEFNLETDLANLVFTRWG
ncbi:hypothetical protein M9H77_13818 [Catharanthus roseus]|uniref:Uncharacterized protein n=1 Tax=Catharanthus roseus TaxID=4058 RepID=A0ACC0BLH9_CATRO|nr:hypothetical protein M9H77_13818 [Catharanthus roseus]